MGGWLDSLLAALFVSLRLVPSFAFAQPFTLMRIPAVVRVLLALSLSLWLADARPALTTDRLDEGGLLSLAAGELLVGMAIALSLQIAFAGILWAGRVLDVQAGFGLATLADPTTQNDQPLIGTILAYGAAALFFLTGAQYDLLAVWIASLEALPLGYALMAPDITAIGTLMGSAFFLSVGLVGAAMLTLFLVDIVIAFLSRTLPQMNMLLLSFQVKAMLSLVVLPISLIFAGALYLRILRLALAGSPGILGLP